MLIAIGDWIVTRDNEVSQLTTLDDATIDKLDGVFVCGSEDQARAEVKRRERTTTAVQQ